MRRGPTKREVKTAVEAVRESGVEVARVEIEDRKITVIAGKPETEPGRELDNWMAKHHAN
jgi:hypothetical protein